MSPLSFLLHSFFGFPSVRHTLTMRTHTHTHKCIVHVQCIRCATRILQAPASWEGSDRCTCGLGEAASEPHSASVISASVLSASALSALARSASEPLSASAPLSAQCFSVQWFSPAQCLVLQFFSAQCFRAAQCFSAAQCSSASAPLSASALALLHQQTRTEANEF